MFFNWFVPYGFWGNRIIAVAFPFLVASGLRALIPHGNGHWSAAFDGIAGAAIAAFSYYLIQYHRRPMWGDAILCPLVSALLWALIRAW